MGTVKFQPVQAWKNGRVNDDEDDDDEIIGLTWRDSR